MFKTAIFVGVFPKYYEFSYLYGNTREFCLVFNFYGNKPVQSVISLDIIENYCYVCGK